MRIILFCLFFMPSLSPLYAGETNQNTTKKVNGQSKTVITPSTQLTTSVNTKPKISNDHNQNKSVLTLPSKATATDSISPGKNKKDYNLQKSFTQAPIFSKISKRCIRPGDIINFQGQHLSSLSNHNLVIKIDNVPIQLKHLSTNNTQLIHQLPIDHRLQANHRYPILLMDPQKPLHYKPTGLAIQVCSFNTNKLNTASVLDHEAGEILILANTNLIDEIQQHAINQGYPILHYRILTSLKKVILTIHVDDNHIKDVITNLQSQYPRAIIDFNNHYQSTATPRTYAADLISWPQNKTCSNNSFKTLTIGMIDGEIDKTHPALPSENITIKNFLKDTDQIDKQHGTAIAVILTGNSPSLGYRGLLPDIKIMAASVLRKNKDDFIATTDNIVQAVDWLMTKNVRLINVSLSGGKANRVLQNVFNDGIQNGLLIFAAAGNNGSTDKEFYPAALPGVMAITAVDAAHHLYQNANQGEYIDFSAPGVDIWTIDGKQGKYRSGTSFATPHALAVAALYLQKNPSLSRGVLYSVMQENVTDLGPIKHDKKFGWGLVKAAYSSCH